MRRLTVLWAVLASLFAAIAVTTPAGAATFTYDVMHAERADVHEFEVAKAATEALSDVREEAASPSADVRGTSTIPSTQIGERLTLLDGSR